MIIEKYIERFRDCRGYNIPEGEAFIVFNKTNEIWDSEDLINYIRISLEEYGRELLETPMGASDWLNHGIKYGYLDYFNLTTK